MKIKEDLMLRDIFGEWMVIPMGERLMEFTGMMKLNETGAFLWKLMNEDTNIDALVDATVSEYDISPDEARAYIEEFVKSLKEANLLDE